jgi:hypothetical protein
MIRKLPVNTNADQRIRRCLSCGLIWTTTETIDEVEIEEDAAGAPAHGRAGGLTGCAASMRK